MPTRIPLPRRRFDCVYGGPEKTLERLLSHRLCYRHLHTRQSSSFKFRRKMPPQQQQQEQQQKDRTTASSLR